jgi:hypothetical protein
MNTKWAHHENHNTTVVREVPLIYFSLLLVECLFSKTQYHYENLNWKSKEINQSESTLTQGTMSRTPFPSSRIFLLSFSFPGDCRMRFSDAPSVYTCFFVLFGFLCFPFFLRRCVWISPLCLPVCFWKYICLCTEPFRQRP